MPFKQVEFVGQHPEDARLSAKELRNIVGRGGETFSKTVQHFPQAYVILIHTGLNNVVVLTDTLGLPTVFFTHIAADMQWPELARLICPHPTDKNSRKQAVIENPAIADCFFSSKNPLFLNKDTLHAKDYWLRFEWQHRGSPHVYGVAWLQGAPT